MFEQGSLIINNKKYIVLFEKYIAQKVFPCKTAQFFSFIQIHTF